MRSRKIAALHTTQAVFDAPLSASNLSTTRCFTTTSASTAGKRHGTTRGHVRVSFRKSVISPDWTPQQPHQQPKAAGFARLAGWGILGGNQFVSYIFSLPYLTEGIYTVQCRREKKKKEKTCSQILLQCSLREHSKLTNSTHKKEIAVPGLM